ncbi:Tyrosine-protein phosphatase YwqE [Rosistilla carotiformis]|uniref:protein-tyrosine-phosphatase n=1 Tax=Rosistilla carotiformis TaxID=2528017 RepID=A0A518JMI3_9BACT|nr:CpsB/CapC family capsule biosynthesis tyrosine phosphatase [Rosistilla carotiformis]QDV66770.1 Tyrosine-protein phosphatase YwqE [Rosistilla carotiformis]
MDEELAFIDIHCHLLPGIDDGARDWDESLAMARIAVQDGIRCSVLTPHQLGQYSLTTGEEIRRLTAEFQTRLQEQGIRLAVRPGADVRIDLDMIQRLASGDCVSLADRRKHVLLELPHELYFPLEPVIANLKKLGMVGILSHPERNEGILKRPELIPPLVEAGCLMQITADSLTGVFGSAPKKMSEWMLQNGLTHFIASDAHGTRRRKPLMRRSFERASELVGEPYAKAICCHNPLAVVNGQAVAKLPQVRRRGWMERILKRQAA